MDAAPDLIEGPVRGDVFVPGPVDEAVGRERQMLVADADALPAPPVVVDSVPMLARDDVRHGLTDRPFAPTRIGVEIRLGQWRQQADQLPASDRGRRDDRLVGGTGDAAGVERGGDRVQVLDDPEQSGASIKLAVIRPCPRHLERVVADRKQVAESALDEAPSVVQTGMRVGRHLGRNTTSVRACCRPAVTAAGGRGLASSAA